jgi:hypothetical protein
MPTGPDGSCLRDRPGSWVPPPGANGLNGLLRHGMVFGSWSFSEHEAFGRSTTPRCPGYFRPLTAFPLRA